MVLLIKYIQFVLLVFAYLFVCLFVFCLSACTVCMYACTFQATASNIFETNSFQGSKNNFEFYFESHKFLKC